jgi:hypothetical protein
MALAGGSPGTGVFATILNKVVQVFTPSNSSDGLSQTSHRPANVIVNSSVLTGHIDDSTGANKFLLRDDDSVYTGDYYVVTRRNTDGTYTVGYVDYSNNPLYLASRTLGKSTTHTYNSRAEALNAQNAATFNSDTTTVHTNGSSYDMVQTDNIQSNFYWNGTSFARNADGSNYNGMIVRHFVFNSLTQKYTVRYTTSDGTPIYVGDGDDDSAQTFDNVEQVREYERRHTRTPSDPPPNPNDGVGDALLGDDSKDDSKDDDVDDSKDDSTSVEVDADGNITPADDSNNTPADDDPPDDASGTLPSDDTPTGGDLPSTPEDTSFSEPHSLNINSVSDAAGPAPDNQEITENDEALDLKNPNEQVVVKLSGELGNQLLENNIDKEELAAQMAACLNMLPFSEHIDDASTNPYAMLAYMICSYVAHLK